MPRTAHLPPWHTSTMSTGPRTSVPPCTSPRARVGPVPRQYGWQNTVPRGSWPPPSHNSHLAPQLPLRKIDSQAARSQPKRTSGCHQTAKGLHLGALSLPGGHSTHHSAYGAFHACPPPPSSPATLAHKDHESRPSHLRPTLDQPTRTARTRPKTVQLAKHGTPRVLAFSRPGDRRSVEGLQNPLAAQAGPGRALEGAPPGAGTRRGPWRLKRGRGAAGQASPALKGGLSSELGLLKTVTTTLQTAPEVRM